MSSHNDLSPELVFNERREQRARDEQRRAERQLKRALLAQVVCETVSDALEYDESEALELCDAIGRERAAHDYHV